MIPVSAVPVLAAEVILSDAPALAVPPSTAARMYPLIFSAVSRLMALWLSGTKGCETMFIFSSVSPMTA